MLKIKDDIDLKELEKFGFVYQAKTDMWLYERKGKVGIEWAEVLSQRKLLSHYTLDVVYDLIQAGLVEKVDDK